MPVREYATYAAASVGSSKSNSDSSTWQNTTLTGQNISLKADGDTTLRGATATADCIDVKTGGTLTIESLHDVAESMSKDSQVGGRVQVSLGTAWDASGYASASKAIGSYKGVGQQSGLFAGDGGYHVDAGHVNLVGGAIASTNPANSELTAQTLTFTDLKNEMDYRASSASISGGFGAEGEKPTDASGNPIARPNAAGQFKDIGSNVANGKYGQADGSNFSGGVPMTTSGSDSSTTYATLTEGNISIGGKKVTAAELGVNTDVSKAHEAISSLPDLQKLMQEQQAMSSAAGTVVSTSKQIAGDVAAAKTKAATDAYLASLGSDKDRADFLAKSSEAQRAILSTRDDYKDAQKWTTGGSYSRALDAVTTAIVGSVAGQGGGQVAANALAPYAAEFIGSKFDPNHGKDPNATLQLISHALLGALLAEANGGSAGNGAIAATGGELAAKYLTGVLYDSDPETLDEQQKQTILALSQAVGALAGGLGTKELIGASLGANVAKNSVENNWLSRKEWRKYQKAVEECKQQLAGTCATRDALVELDSKRQAEFASYAISIRADMLAAGEPLTEENFNKRAAAYWSAQGFDEEDVYYIGNGHRATYPTAGQELYDGLGELADSRYGKSMWAQLKVGQLLLSGAGDTVAGWADLFTNGNSNNFFTGENLSGVAAQDSRFLGIVGFLTPGGFLSARAKTATNILDNAEIGINWGKGINLQGMPFEDYVATVSSPASRLPPGFKSLDFFDRETGVATSVKTLDTSTPAKLGRPADVYSSLKNNIDTLAKFEGSQKAGVSVKSSEISSRVLQVGIPSDATSLQMYQVQRAIEYGKTIGVTVKIIRVN